MDPRGHNTASRCSQNKKDQKENEEPSPVVDKSVPYGEAVQGCYSPPAYPQPVAHRARFAACPGRSLERHARAVDERYIRQPDLISLKYSVRGIRRAVLKLFRFIPAAELRKLFYSLKLVRHLNFDWLRGFLKTGSSVC
jgi:hypothetical protein